MAWVYALVTFIVVHRDNVNVLTTPLKKELLKKAKIYRAYARPHNLRRRVWLSRLGKQQSL